MTAREYERGCNRCGKFERLERVTHACGCVYQYCDACLRDDFSRWDRRFLTGEICSTKDWIDSHSRGHLFDHARCVGSKMTPLITVLWDTKTKIVRASGDLNSTWPWDKHSPVAEPGESYTYNHPYTVTWLVRCPVLPEEPQSAFRRVRLTGVPLDMFCLTPEKRVR